MKRIACLPVIAATTALLFCPGCITFYRSTEEIGKGEERLNVEFETEHAAQLFNVTVSEKLQKPAPKDRSSFSVPFVTFYSKTRVMSENARYNAEVRKCDTDGDGIITEAEARTYWMGSRP